MMVVIVPVPERRKEPLGLCVGSQPALVELFWQLDAD